MKTKTNTTIPTIQPSTNRHDGYTYHEIGAVKTNGLYEFDLRRTRPAAEQQAALRRFRAWLLEQSRAHLLVLVSDATLDRRSPATSTTRLRIINEV